ncbi:MAG: polysaccharide deacetylase family protein [bacterium]|nr:polysaccharide deacetylase family protein [bacterium]
MKNKIFKKCTILTAMLFFGIALAGCEDRNTEENRAMETGDFKYYYVDSINNEAGSCFDQSYDIAGNTTVLKWRDGKKAAMSITFDDNLLSQYTVAVPEMRKYGFRGTFFVVAQWVNDRMIKPTIARNIKELHLQGHEIGSHSYSHQYLTKVSRRELLFEILESKKVIERLIGKNTVTTFRYPWLDMDEQTNKIVKRNYLWISTLVPTDSLFYVYSGIDTLKEKIDTAIETNGWFTTMFHGVEKDFLPISLAEFKEYLEVLHQKRDILWVAPMREIAAYNDLRDSVKITSGYGGLGLRATKALKPFIKKTTLSVRTNFPDDWDLVKITKGKQHYYLKTQTDDEGRFLMYTMGLQDRRVKFEKAVIDTGSFIPKKIEEFDFESNDQLERWNIVEGDWYIENGTLLGSSDISKIVLDRPGLKDIKITGRFNIIGNGEQNTSNSFASFFVRAQTVLPGENNGIYYVLDNHSSISDFRTNHVLLWDQWKTRDETTQPWAWPDRVISSMPAEIPVDGWHDFEIYLVGEKILYRVDNRDVLIDNRIRLEEGSFGLRNRGSSVSFDDITIYKI